MEKIEKNIHRSDRYLLLVAEEEAGRVVEEEAQDGEEEGDVEEIRHCVVEECMYREMGNLVNE